MSRTQRCEDICLSDRQQSLRDAIESLIDAPFFLRPHAGRNGGGHRSG